MKSKKAKTGMMLGVFGTILVLILGILTYSVFINQSQVSTITEKTITSGDGGCNIAPSVVNAVVDEKTPGTTVTTTNSYRLNGAYTGTTAPTTKGTADILWNSSGYLNAIKNGVNIGCGSNLVTGTMLAYANSTLTYYSNNGLTALTMSTSNETAAAAGGSYNWKLHMQGVDKKSTGKQLLVVELSVPANVSSVSLNGGSEVAVPNGYSRQITNGYAKAFLLPAITGNVAVDYNLAVAAATSKVVSGTVYSTIYSVEPFVETDGSFSDKGDAFNSLNAAKYHDSQTKNFIIA